MSTNESKKRWRVLPITGRTRRAMAKNIETSMNSLEQDGYDVRIIDISDTSFIMGVLRASLQPSADAEPPVAFIELLRNMSGGSPPPGALKPDVVELLEPLHEMLRKTDPDNLGGVAQSFQKLCKTVPPERLREMVNELRVALEAHDCANPKMCLTSRTLAFAHDQLPKYLRQNVS